MTRGRLRTCSRFKGSGTIGERDRRRLEKKNKLEKFLDYVREMMYEESVRLALYFLDRKRYIYYIYMYNIYVLYNRKLFAMYIFVSSCTATTTTAVTRAMGDDRAKYSTVTRNTNMV